MTGYIEHRKNPTEHEKDRFISSIRDILSQPGTSESWLSLCRILDSIRAFEVSEQVFFVDYLKQHVDHWPSGLRRPFYAWWEHQRDGHLEPVWELVGDTSMWLWDAGQEAGEKRSYPFVPNLNVIWCPPGTFTMGAKEEDEDAIDTEKPAHSVQISKGFWITQTPITNEQYRYFIPRDVLDGELPRKPVACVSWYDAAKFANLLSLEEGAPASFIKKGREFRSISHNNYYHLQGWRLPTEAEWEYACCSGKNHQEVLTSFSEEEVGVNRLSSWHRENSANDSHSVGQKEPTEWGLYDMLGNVWEWVYDGFREYTESEMVDPLGQIPEEAGVIRGGGWFCRRKDVRETARRRFHLGRVDRSDLGFRLAMSHS